GPVGRRRPGCASNRRRRGGKSWRSREWGQPTINSNTYRVKTTSATALARKGFPAQCQTTTGAAVQQHSQVIEPKDKPAGPRKCRSLAETRDTPFPLRTR